MLNIVLFGPPGAGKGTQAHKLVEKYGFNHISTGEIIRTEIGRRTPLGRSMEEYISRGELAPDDLVIGMITDYVENHRDVAGNIFDGFPRTEVQAGEFDRIMLGLGMPVDVMISLEVPYDELVRRLLLRGKESGRSDDMNEEVIRNRLAIYEEVTAVVARHYRAQNKYAPVDGTGSIDEIFGRLAVVVDKYL